jgi:hypothetical protein
MSDSSVGSRVEARLMSAMRFVGLLFFLLAAGCAAVERTPPQTGSPQGEVVAVEPSMTGSTGQDAARTESPAAKAPAKKPAEQPATKPSATPSSRKPGAPPLDLTALETRLKETRAIGVFTKITLKNQVDDLLNQFRAYYQGRIKITLAELRQPYDRLLLKVLSLLQDGDPELARAVVASREAIWGILADPAKFATL